MSGKQQSKTAGAEQAEHPKPPFALLMLAWFVPGAGHLVLKRFVRAGVFAGVVLAAFVTGILISGELAVPQRGNPFSYLAAAGCIGNGVLYFVCKILGLGHGDPAAAGFNYGNTFLYTAGLMNLLTVLDVSDIVTGRKD